MRQKFITLLIVLHLFIAFSITAVYSEDSKVCQPSLMEKVLKAEDHMNKINPPKRANDPATEKHMAAVQQCSENYDKCLDKCAEIEKDEDYDKCDKKCKEELSLCEGQPHHLGTVK